jgi:hypothetical protein
MKHIKYETGATSHAVNDLILFTDNTRELAEMRDRIYERMCEYHNQQENELEIRFFSDWNKLRLFATRDYMRAFPNHDDHKHILSEDLFTARCGEWTFQQTTEYIKVYLADFNNWKLEHGYTICSDM